MKRFGFFGILLLAAWPLAAAGNGSAPAGSTSANAGPGGVQQLNDAFLKALQAGDIDGIMKLYAADAILFPPGEKVAKGQEEIRFKWNNLIEANKISETSLKEAKYVASPTVSAGWGDVSMKLEPKNGKPPKTIQGRFSTVAEKRNGKWAYVFVGIGELDEILTLDHYSKSK
jgi:ketosteroid isomerase-like protein